MVRLSPPGQVLLNDAGGGGRQAGTSGKELNKQLMDELASSEEPVHLESLVASRIHICQCEQQEERGSFFLVSASSHD